MELGAKPPEHLKQKRRRRLGHTYNDWIWLALLLGFTDCVLQFSRVGQNTILVLRDCDPSSSGNAFEKFAEIMNHRCHCFHFNPHYK